MITDEDYIEFQKWWKDTIKKYNDIIQLPETNALYIKIPNEYKCNFPGVLYRQTKQANALKLYGKKNDGSLEELQEHELYDMNRNSKQRKEYIYNENDWFID